MLNKIIINFLSFTLFFSSILDSSEYKISLVGTECLVDVFVNYENYEDNISIGINDNGQVFGILNKKNTTEMYICDPQKGISLINQAMIGLSSSDWQPYKLILNNNNQILFGDGEKIYLYDLISGLQIIDPISNLQAMENSPIYGYSQPMSFNDKGQIIGKIEFYGNNGYYAHRPFFWENGTIIDMGPNSKFSQEFEKKGYYILDLRLNSLNNKGEIAGEFTYGKFNERKNEYVKIGKKAFFWNDEIHVISLPADSNNFAKIKLNNKGTVLILTETNYEKNSYIWNLEQGLKEVSGFMACDLNDENIILGQSKYMNRPAIWKDGYHISIAQLLGNKDLSNLAPPYSDTYEVERIEKIIGLNNKGQILGIGYVWGEYHPCIIEPNKLISNSVNNP